jgi:tetratricopeptide (TPR) repeat protein
MMRFLGVALLMLQAMLTGQERATATPNPFQDDECWSFHLHAEARAEWLRKSTSNVPLEALEANLALENNLAAVRSARGLLSEPVSTLETGLRRLLRASIQDDGTTVLSEMQNFVAAARRRIDALPVSEGAEAAAMLLQFGEPGDALNPEARKQRLRDFLARYAGTPAAERIDPPRAETERYDAARELQRYRERAAKYDGTEIGAMALHSLAFRRGHDPEYGNSDPSDRLLEVFDIVKQLESGRFPSGWPVFSAGDLVRDFFFGGDARIPPERVPVVYARYLEFVLAHPTTRTSNGYESGPGWIIANGVARLGREPRDQIAIVDRFLADLAKNGFDANTVRFLRADFYFGLPAPGTTIDGLLEGGVHPKEADARGMQSLRDVVASGVPAAAARAGAMMARQHFEMKRYVEARSELQRLAAQFPDAEWAWIPALRIAQINEHLGAKSAVTDYEVMASKPGRPAAAVVLSRVSAGEVHEARREYPAARAHYRAALDAWQSIPNRINLRIADDGPVFRRFADLPKEEIVRRVDRLAGADTVEGALLYEGRRAIELGKPADAIKPLRRIVDRYGASTATAEARLLLRRARFENAVISLARDGNRAERELDALTRGPHDSTTALAKLAIGALSLTKGARREAAAITRQALDEWFARQEEPTAPASDVEREAVAILRVMFDPRSSGISGWSEWPQAMPAMLLFDTEVRIKAADAGEEAHQLRFTPPSGPRVIFIDGSARHGLELILDHLGGTDHAEPANVMDVPNQPIGGALQIAQHWAQYFPMRPGHWGGWELTPYPSVSRILFDRDNHAVVDFGNGYSGGTAELVKENGLWLVKRIVSTWVT